MMIEMFQAGSVSCGAQRAWAPGGRSCVDAGDGAVDKQGKHTFHFDGLMRVLD